MPHTQVITDGICAPTTQDTHVVEDAVGVSEALRWFVAIVNSRHEKLVGERLTELSVENYVAVQREMHLWKNGRRKMVERVVVPSMVFVKTTERERRNLVKLPFIYRFLVNRSGESGTLNKPVAVISQHEIDTLRFMLGQSDYPVSFDPSVFRVNDTVRVIRGKLCGLQGEVRSTPEGRHRLIVSLPLLGGATVFIDPHDLEKI